MPDKNKSFNTPLVDDEMIGFITREEKYVPYLYQDAKGKVTAGIGFHIPNEKEATSYPFRHMIDESTFGRSATKSEIEDAYRKISKRSFNKNMAFKAFTPFEPNSELSRIGLEKNDSRELTRQKLLQSEKYLEGKFKDFQAIEKPARQVLLDLEYNIGPTKFRREYEDPETKQMKPGWPKLFDAIDARNYEAAAEQVESGDVGPDRNHWRRTNMLRSLD